MKKIVAALTLFAACAGCQPQDAPTEPTKAAEQPKKKFGQMTDAEKEAEVTKGLEKKWGKDGEKLKAQVRENWEKKTPEEKEAAKKKIQEINDRRKKELDEARDGLKKSLDELKPEKSK